jgi:hypothetical protein
LFADWVAVPRGVQRGLSLIRRLSETGCLLRSEDERLVFAELSDPRLCAGDGCGLPGVGGLQGTRPVSSGSHGLHEVAARLVEAVLAEPSLSDPRGV